MPSPIEPSDRPRIEVDSAEPLTLHTRAVLEVGKALLTDSIDTGREFCKFMVTAPVGAIPVYLAVAAILFPEHYRPGFTAAAALLAPPFVLIVATIVAACGYLPRRTLVSLEIVDEIDRERNRLILWRRRLGIVAFSFFLLGILSAIMIVVLILYGVIGPNVAVLNKGA